MGVCCPVAKAQDDGMTVKPLEQPLLYNENEGIQSSYPAGQKEIGSESIPQTQPYTETNHTEEQKHHEEAKYQPEPEKKSKFSAKENAKVKEVANVKLPKFKVSTDLFSPIRDSELNKNYQIGRQISNGANIVFVVGHIDTKLSYAMKVIPKTKAVLTDGGNFFEEAKILTGVDHPNIMKVCEVYQDDQSFYMISEYYTGGALFDRIKALSQFSESQAADYMKQIISAVNYLHQNGIMHRDIKAENFLFASDAPDASIKLIDFASATKFTPGEKLQKLVGNYTYIAPEILKKNYDERADAWSIGVLLYIMLGGNPPFTGSTNKEITAKIKAAKYSFEGEEWKDISEGAKDLISKLLVADPDQRISLADAYQHSWIQSNTSTQPIDARALSNLSNFKIKNNLQHAIFYLITTHLLPSASKEKLQKVFVELDKNGNGTLSKEEVLEGCKLAFGSELTPEEIEKIFQAVDSNESGEIDFNEFVLACFSREQLLSPELLLKAYKYFDSDNNGFIAIGEFKEIMAGANLTEKEWNDLFLHLDVDKSGKITDKEFMKIAQGF